MYLSESRKETRMEEITYSGDERGDEVLGVSHSGCRRWVGGGGKEEGRSLVMVKGLVSQSFNELWDASAVPKKRRLPLSDRSRDIPVINGACNDNS